MEIDTLLEYDKREDLRQWLQAYHAEEGVSKEIIPQRESFIWHKPQTTG